MAVNLIAPDGSPVNTDPEHVDSLLADGYQLASDDPGAPEGPLPKLATSPMVPIMGAPQTGEGMPLGDVVNLRAPDGSAVNADRENVESLLADGYQLAGAEDVSAQRDIEANSTLDAQAITAGEQFAQGATLGAYGAIGEFADEGYGRRMQARAEANPMTATVAGVAGAIAPAALSGGVGSVGSLARLTPAGQLANLATKMGTVLGARATSGIGRIGALALTGAAEATVDATTRQVMGDLAAGNVEITAERMLDAAWDGARMGALLGGGLGALVEGGQAAARGVKAVAEKLPSLPSVDDFASGRAFKAVLGKTNVKGVRQAYKHFDSPEAVGRTMLEEGIVTADATIEDIAERAASLRSQLGRQLGDAVKQADELSGGAGMSRSALKQKLYDDVIAPLKQSPINRDVGARLESQLSGLLDELTPSPVTVRGKGPMNRDGLSFEQADKWRKELDQRISWEQMAPDVAGQAKRDIRRAMSEFWTDSADAAAARSGKAGFADEIRSLKKRFSHVALADDLANDAIASKLSNRFMSPSDYGMGAAAALLTGGSSVGALASGAVASQANRIIRERGNQVVAATLYRLGRGAVKQEKAVEGAVESTLRSLTEPARIIPVAAKVTARAAIPAASIERMVAQSQALQDPESPESHQLEAMVLQVAGESPEMADALKAAVMRKATFVVQKMGPQTDPSDPLGRQPMPQDRVTRSRNERFMVAVQNPAAALERLSNGTGSAEDLAVVRELTPMVHKRWADAVIERVVSGGVKLDSKQKNRMLFMLGQPVVREQTPDYVQWYQATWQKQRGAQEQQQQQQAPSAPQQPNFHGKDFKVDGHFASRADQLMGGVNVE